LRVTNELGGPVVVLVNGGRAAELPGTWSASLEYLVRRSAPRFPRLGFVEVKYRIRSWRRLDECVEDAREALERVGDVPVAILGFSMGGAVATRVAADPRVRRVVGVNPWLPDQLDVSPLAGKELQVVHGSLDRALPGIPGVSPGLSRRGYERALEAGARGEFATVRGGLHALALRSPAGLVPLPRASRYAAVVGRYLQAFAGSLADD
jgi:pimeloyl-ACP methyl ester carboxylesterase